MVQIFWKLFLISAMCTLLVIVHTLTERETQVFAQDATLTPFFPIGTFTPTPEEISGERIFVKVSHYWPPLGGPNCAVYIGTPPNGECISRMANNERWQDWVGIAIACPGEWAFETRLVIADQIWVCKDHGEDIKYDENGYPWIDMLISDPSPYSFGDIVEATILPEQYVFESTE